MRMTWGQSYKTIYGRNLRIFVISWSVRPWQAFAASLMPGAYPRPGKVLSTGRLPPYPQTLD
jgi:hypothetical protein